MGPRGGILSCHQSQMLQRCGLVWPSVVVGPQLLRTHWQARLVPGPSSCGLATTVVGMLVCRAVFWCEWLQGPASTTGDTLHCVDAD